MAGAGWAVAGDWNCWFSHSKSLDTSARVFEFEFEFKFEFDIVTGAAVADRTAAVNGVVFEEEGLFEEEGADAELVGAAAEGLRGSSGW